MMAESRGMALHQVTALNLEYCQLLMDSIRSRHHRPFNV